MNMTSFPVGGVSDDGLWQWNGKAWQSVADVIVRCGRCETDARVPSKKSEYKCSQGHHQSFVACTTCKRPFQVASEKKDHTKHCPHCGIPSLWAKKATAWEFVTDERQYGTSVGHDGRRSVGILPDFTLNVGVGTAIAIGTLCSIEFTAADVVIKASYGHVDVIPFGQVRELQVTGRTELGKDADVSRGARGALGAMSPLAAGIGRKSTHIDTALRIASATSEYVFVSQAMDSNHLTRLLEPIKARIREAEVAPPPPAPLPTQLSSSVADELTKLAQLRDGGVLSDAEFATAKARLLGNL
jgi:DNA-directed RNA polymerase subunit RPC12/RpoP